MKNLTFLYVSLLSFIILTTTSACFRPSSELVVKEVNQKSKVEVLYFHGKQRCLSCRAIERFARETVDNAFRGNDSVVFRSVDIAEPTGEALADRYKIAGSALLVVNNVRDTNLSIYSDMTEFAFRNARKNTETFKEGLKNKIIEYLKKQ